MLDAIFAQIKTARRLCNYVFIHSIKTKILFMNGALIFNLIRLFSFTE